MKTVNDSVPHYHYSFTFSFEDTFDVYSQFTWFKENFGLSFYLVILYCLTIYLLKTYMKYRPRIELKIFSFVWNISLSIFSLMTVIRIWPDLYFDLTEYGFEYTVCDSGYLLRNRVFGFWVSFFTYSKFIEFGDTLILILRKRPLTFLHVYHHITVAMGIFYFVTREIAMARWVPLINGWIHTIMYMYFGLKVVNVRIPKLFSMFLTIMQIYQLLFFVIVILLANYLNLVPGKICSFPLEDSMITCPVVLSYALLFMNYFYHAYLKQDTSKTTVKKRD